jgi:hypothetical protein
MKKIGAPKKTICLLPSHWQEALLELYRQGGSDKEVKALIYSWMGSFSNDLMGAMDQRGERFSETVKKGKNAE